MSSDQLPGEPANVPWPDMVKFVRQLGHDIRNHLNAVELQSAYLAELAEEGELKGEVQRLREMIAGIGASLRKLSAGRAQPNPQFMAHSAEATVEAMQQKGSREVP